MPPELNPGRFFTLTKEEAAARAEADRQNAQLFGQATGEAGDDYRVLREPAEAVVEDVAELHLLAEEGAVPV